MNPDDYLQDDGCDRCQEWQDLGLGVTCPGCDLIEEEDVEC